MSEKFAAFLATDTNTTALPLPVVTTDRVAVVRGLLTYYASALYAARPIYVRSVPSSGATLTAVQGQQAYVLDPVAAIDDLTVVLPPFPVDGDIFEISTTEDIGGGFGASGLVVNAAAGQTISRGQIDVLSAGGGASWRYVVSQTKWYRRY